MNGPELAVLFHEARNRLGDDIDAMREILRTHCVEPFLLGLEQIEGRREWHWAFGEAAEACSPRWIATCRLSGPHFMHRNDSLPGSTTFEWATDADLRDVFKDQPHAPGWGNGRPLSSFQQLHHLDGPDDDEVLRWAPYQQRVG